MTNPAKTIAWSALVLGLTASPAFAADSGADVFKQKCAICHGENGAGKGKVPALGSAEVQAKSDADLKAATEKGVKTDNGMMPGYAGKLTPEQVDAVVAYIRSLKK